MACGTPTWCTCRHRLLSASCRHERHRTPRLQWLNAGPLGHANSPAYSAPAQRNAPRPVPRAPEQVLQQAGHMQFWNDDDGPSLANAVINVGSNVLCGAGFTSRTVRLGWAGLGWAGVGWDGWLSCRNRTPGTQSPSRRGAAALSVDRPASCLLRRSLDPTPLARPAPSRLRGGGRRMWAPRRA